MNSPGSVAVIRRKGTFVLKLDASGLQLCRLLSHQTANQQNLRLDQYSSKLDDKGNLVYFQDGKYGEKDLAKLIDVPDSLLEFRADDMVFVAKGSLVDHFISQTSSLDKEVQSLLKADDLWGCKSDYKRKRSRDDASPAIAKSNGHGHTPASSQDEDSEEVTTTGFVNGTYIVFETVAGIQFGKIIQVYPEPHEDGCNAMVLTLVAKTSGNTSVYSPGDAVDVNTHQQVGALPQDILVYSKSCDGYFCTTTPMHYWPPMPPSSFNKFAPATSKTTPEPAKSKAAPQPKLTTIPKAEPKPMIKSQLQVDSLIASELDCGLETSQLEAHLETDSNPEHELQRKPELQRMSEHSVVKQPFQRSTPIKAEAAPEPVRLPLRQGAFVLKLDAFGLSLGRLQHPLVADQALRLERFELQQDEEYNVLFYHEGGWVEKDIASLVVVPDSLLEHRPKSNFYKATGSLVEHYISLVKDLDRDVVSFLKAEDKWKYKLSYEYRLKHRKQKKRKFEAKVDAVDIGGGDGDDGDDLIHEVDEPEQVQLAIDLPWAEFPRGSTIAFENESGVYFGRIKYAYSSLRGPNESTHSVHVLLLDESKGVYHRGPAIEMNLSSKAVLLADDDVVFHRESRGYIAKDDPVAFINWEPAVGITRSRRSIRPGEASEAPSSRDTFKPKPKIGPFGYIGVSRLNDEKRRFVAHLQCGDELRRVPGLFESPVEAALAYDEYARSVLGNKAELNFVVRTSLLPAYGCQQSGIAVHLST